MEMKQNQTYLQWNIFESDIIFIGGEILKYFNDFCNW